MNQGLSPSLNPPLFDQLGDFAKLPPEIRHQIWNYILDYVLEAPATYNEYLYRYYHDALSIIFCNRHINEEVSYLLYHGRDPWPHIFIYDLDKSGEEIDLWVKTNTGQAHHLKTSGLEDAIEIFRKFPFWRTKRDGLRITVGAPTLCSGEYASRHWERIVEAFDAVRDKPDDQYIEFTALVSRPLMSVTMRYCAQDQSTTTSFDLGLPASMFSRRMASVDKDSN